jgi:hypothetical protein
MTNHYEILAKASGLTAEEVQNLETYGVKHPSEFADLDQNSSECMCGETNCPDAYAHTTSGY